MTLFKKIVCFCFLIVFCGNISLAQCPPAGVGFSTQADVDSFAVNYPNCTEIEDLFIGTLSYFIPSDINDLSPLEGLTSVEVNLVIERTGLSDLSGLDNLSYVGSTTRIFDNPNLKSLTGLENLTSTEYMDIELNDSLTNLIGLENLTSINPLEQ